MERGTQTALTVAGLVVVLLIAGLIGYAIGHRVVPDPPDPPKAETTEVTKWRTHIEPTTIIKREDCDCPGPTDPDDGDKDDGDKDGETTLPDTGGTE